MDRLKFGECLNCANLVCIPSKFYTQKTRCEKCHDIITYHSTDTEPCEDFVNGTPKDGKGETW